MLHLCSCYRVALSSSKIQQLLAFEWTFTARRSRPASSKCERICQIHSRRNVHGTNLQGWRQPVYQNLLVDLTDERVKGGSLEVKIAQKRRASPATCIQYPPPPTDRMHQHTCKDEISSEKNKHKELLPPQAERTRFALRLRAGLVLQHHQSSSVSGAGDGLPTSYRALLIIMAPGSTAVRIAAGSQCKGIAPNLKVCGYHFIFSNFLPIRFYTTKDSCCSSKSTTTRPTT